MAWYHSRLIKRHEPIYHGIWSAAYLAGVGIAIYLTGEWFLLPILLVLRKVVFDLSLNLFRGLSLWYVSGTSGSVLDQLNLRVFKNIKVMYGAYTALWVILNALYYVTKN
jgi:hypothetical protein